MEQMAEKMLNFYIEKNKKKIEKFYRDTLLYGSAIYKP